MPDTIYLDKYSGKVNSDYVGFGLYKGRKVKPVHVANGVFRVLFGKILNTKGIKMLALVESNKGLKGYDSTEVYNKFLSEDRIDEDIKIEDFDATRRVIQNLLNADSAVFIDKSKSDHMLSFSLSSKYFITAKALYEDAGEFIGNVLRFACPNLTDYIVSLLERADDPISQLFIPVEDNSTPPSDLDIPDTFGELYPDNARNDNMNRYLDALKNSGQYLLSNLQNQPNVFSQLRLFNIFCMFSLFRYISYLESFAMNTCIPPILLDFSRDTGSVADASSCTYANIRRSLSRFCSWAYARLLEKDYSEAELKHSEAPIRKAGAVSNDTKGAINSIWNMAKTEAADLEGFAVYETFGKAINSILSRETDFHPGNYLRAVGILPGILYPPNSSNNRFVLSQDVLEMLLMCTVEPGVPVTGKTIRDRLWKNCGVIIGGSAFEEEVISNAGILLQADADALEQNFDEFAQTMEELGFADVKADGILQIHLGGA